MPEAKEQRSDYGEDNGAEEDSQGIRLFIGIDSIHSAAEHIPYPLEQNAETGGILLIVPGHRKPPKKRMAGHGANPTPHQATALAAGGTLGLAEHSETDAQQRDADEHAQNGVSGHHVPNIADNSLNAAHIPKNAGYGGGSTGLRQALLSKDLWLRGEESNLHLQVESLAS